MPRGGRLDAHSVGVGDLHRRPGGDDLEGLAEFVRVRPEAQLIADFLRAADPYPPKATAALRRWAERLGAAERRAPRPAAGRAVNGGTA